METVQLNVRLKRSVKDQGDATLAMAGSSPAKIIRKLWIKLAQGGEAYERISQVLSDGPEADGPSGSSSVDHAAHLFENLGSSLGLDISGFTPYGRSEDELMEEIEWEHLIERGQV